MRAKGIAYDTGFIYNGSVSREHVDPAVITRELAIIRDHLHCNAVQVVGGNPGRLEAAARCAAELGLEVWFSPYPLNLTPEEIVSLFSDCAARAERLREAGAEVVFVAGAELTIMDRGFLPGGTQQERLANLLSEPGRRERLNEISARFNDFLGRAVTAIRARFGGTVTYASIPFERPDWSLFDVVAVELIRNAAVADRYREGVRSLVAGSKPVAITGFGASTYAGAGERGGRGMEIMEYDQATGAPLRLDGHYIRDEAGQAENLREVLEILDAEGVDSAFIWLFELSSFPHRPDGDPRDDLDLASPAIVKTLEGRRGETYPDMTWEPKAAFHAVAGCYAGRAGCSAASRRSLRGDTFLPGSSVRAERPVGSRAARPARHDAGTGTGRWSYPGRCQRSRSGRADSRIAGPGRPGPVQRTARAVKYLPMSRMPEASGQAVQVGGNLPGPA